MSPYVSTFSLQLANPDSVEGLVLVNIDTNARGWIDWAAQKVRFYFFFFFIPFFLPRQECIVLYSETCGILIKLVLMRVLHQFKFSCGHEIMTVRMVCVSE